MRLHCQIRVCNERFLVRLSHCGKNTGTIKAADRHLGVHSYCTLRTNTSSAEVRVCDGFVSSAYTASAGAFGVQMFVFMYNYRLCGLQRAKHSIHETTNIPIFTPINIDLPNTRVAPHAFVVHRLRICKSHPARSCVSKVEDRCCEARDRHPISHLLHQRAVSSPHHTNAR